MSSYSNLSTQELTDLRDNLASKHASFVAKNLSLNMARGKPASAQLDLSMPLLDCMNTSDTLKATSGDDCRNYGVLDGISQARELMATMLDTKASKVIVCGNSSLKIMYDTICGIWNFGTLGHTPWSKLDKVKFLCPVPGYDRHFAILEHFGIEMINIKMDEHGPDVSEISAMVAADDSIKGIWCVPKYSNPSGITYSDEVVRKLASMECAAPDFRIFWDNAYAVHHLCADANDQDKLLDIAAACFEAGNSKRYFKFASTSKVTFPGAGIAAISACGKNLAEIKARMEIQTIGYNKINQLAHVKFLRDAKGIATHMQKHADIIAPKFDLVCEKLGAELGEIECGSWTVPNGGYFISYDAPDGCAKRTVELCKLAGVVLTGAGATYPYGKDPKDSNIRIAPTFPPLDELSDAMDIFTCCAKLAWVEKLLT